MSPTTARMPAAVTRPMPGVVSRWGTRGSSMRAGATVVGRQLERCQPGPAARPEGIAQWGSHEAAAEDGAHPVTGGGAVADQPGAVGDDAAQPAGRLGGDPDRPQGGGGPARPQ